VEEEFSRMNLGPYKPKKDQCDVCCGHQVGSISDEQFETHQERKTAARAEKDQDKELAQSETSIRVISLCFCHQDLMQVRYITKLNWRVTILRFSICKLKKLHGFFGMTVKVICPQTYLLVV
jgi:hypothetical protein